MKAEELKRYDAYPILVHTLREAIAAGKTDEIPPSMIRRWEQILEALNERGDINGSSNGD